MGQEWFNDEAAQLASSLSHQLVLSHSLGNPLLGSSKICVNVDESQLSTTLDQLVGLGHKFLSGKKETKF